MARTTSPPTGPPPRTSSRSCPPWRWWPGPARAFLASAAHYLATNGGISQFLDIGTGLPTANNTHEVAQRVNPQARIVYVDNDPIMLSHARALLTSTPEGACAYLDADLRDTVRILREAAAPSTSRAGRAAGVGRGPVGVSMRGRNR